MNEKKISKLFKAQFVPSFREHNEQMRLNTNDEWLNDEIISLYINYLVRNKNENINHVIMYSTYIALFEYDLHEKKYKELMRRSNRWAKKAKEENTRFYFFPRNKGGSRNESGSHWTLLVYDSVKNELYILDSFHHEDKNMSKIFEEYLSKELVKEPAKGKTPKFKSVVVKGVQKQTDGH